MIWPKLLKDKIILFDRLSSIWERVLFENETINEKIPLNIKIGSKHNDSKVDVLVNSLIKFRIFDPDKIKVIELTD